jgi:hypothetical protein
MIKSAVSCFRSTTELLNARLAGLNKMSAPLDTDSGGMASFPADSQSLSNANLSPAPTASTSSGRSANAPGASNISMDLQRMACPAASGSSRACGLILVDWFAAEQRLWLAGWEGAWCGTSRISSSTRRSRPGRLDRRQGAGSAQGRCCPICFDPSRLEGSGWPIRQGLLRGDLLINPSRLEIPS